MSDHLIETMARAYVNATKPQPICVGTVADAYDLLKDWATAVKSKMKPGTLGYRAHEDNFIEAKNELEEAHKIAESMLTALSSAGIGTYNTETHVAVEINQYELLREEALSPHFNPETHVAVPREKLQAVESHLADYMDDDCGLISVEMSHELVAAMIAAEETE